jgi:tetratricopeptide (TPR) repeat protein
VQALDSKTITPPSEWAALIGRQSSVAALPLAAGNYPQRVRDLQLLLQNADLTSLRPTASESTPASSGLKKWSDERVRKGDFPQVLVAAGVLRGAGDLDGAAAALGQLRAKTAANDEGALANEEAALLWERGDWDKAAQLWNDMAESVPVLFNRGMAALFLGRNEQARASLRKAIAALAEDDAWYHLASLYLALAEMRG